VEMVGDVAAAGGSGLIIFACAGGCNEVPVSEPWDMGEVGVGGIAGIGGGGIDVGDKSTTLCSVDCFCGGEE